MPLVNPLPFYGMPSVENRFHSMDIELINYCANNCVFCCAKDRPKKRKIMSIEALELLLQKAPGFHGNVTLSDTGDPIILDDLPGKIELIKRYWPECTLNITTTLSLPRSSEYFCDLFASGLDQVMLSLYAFDEQDYSRLQGSSNFRYVMGNLETLAGVKGAVKRLWLKDMKNFNDVYPVQDYEEKREKFLKIFHALGFSQIFNTIVLPVVSDDAAGTFWNAPIPCNVVWGERAGMCEIHADLDVVPCCLFPNDKVTFGNLRDNSLEEVFNSSEAKDFRKKWWNMRQNQIPVCRRCKCYDTSVSNQEEYDRIIYWQSRKLRDSQVLFWGHGVAWRRYKCFFDGCRPVGMISEDYSQTGEIEGIPVVRPEILMKPEFADIPLVIFAYAEESRRILTLIEERYGRSIKSIFVCPPAYVMNKGNSVAYYDQL